MTEPVTNFFFFFLIWKLQASQRLEKENKFKIYFEIIYLIQVMFPHIFFSE